MASVDFDLGFIGEGVETLDTYLKSKILFWPLNSPSPPGEPAYARLTLGNLLLMISRLEARDLTPPQKRIYQLNEIKISKIKTNHKAGWVRKAKKELSSRINQWQNYLNDFQKNRELSADFYKSEVRVRAIIQLLISETNEVPENELEKLDAIDNTLIMIFIPGEFIWDPDVKSGFPQQEYWFLWGKPIG